MQGICFKKQLPSKILRLRVRESSQRFLVSPPFVFIGVVVVVVVVVVPAGFQYLTTFPFLQPSSIEPKGTSPPCHFLREIFHLSL